MAVLIYTKKTEMIKDAQIANGVLELMVLIGLILSLIAGRSCLPGLITNYSSVNHVTWLIEFMVNFFLRLVNSFLY